MVQYLCWMYARRVSLYVSDCRVSDECKMNVTVRDEEFGAT